MWALVIFALAAIAVGAYLTIAGNKVDVPNLVGRKASEAADVAHRRGLEIALRPRRCPTTSRATR